MKMENTVFKVGKKKIRQKLYHLPWADTWLLFANFFLLYFKNFCFLVVVVDSEAPPRDVNVDNIKRRSGCIPASPQTIGQRSDRQSTSNPGSVWITLNSFIWNIKTMKHKPSTKRQLHVSYHTALKKTNRLHWKTTCFFSSLTDGEGDAQNALWNVSDAIYMLRIQSAEGQTGTAIFVWGRRARPPAQDFGELLWWVRTNEAVWGNRPALETQPLVPIIVKSCRLGTRIHIATNVHVQH